MGEGWTKLLEEHGDPFECGASKEFQLHEKFPLYCEIWGRFVYPNRDRDDPSKLEQGFPPELEDLFNHHYGVWYHLTFAYRQIAKVQDRGSAIDIIDPLFHMATAIELVESVFVIALILQKRIKHETPYANWTQQELLMCTRGKWPRNNEKKWDFFDANTSNTRSKEKFRKIAYERIKYYRNALTHSLIPLKLVDESGKIWIPVRKVLNEYEGGGWSRKSREASGQDFELADGILQRFADQLIEAVNAFWEDLLPIVGLIINSERYKSWFPSVIGFDYGEFLHFGATPSQSDVVESGMYPEKQHRSDRNVSPPYSGGTVETNRLPSGIKYVPPGKKGSD